MTNKNICKCGHDEDRHYYSGIYYCSYDSCSCKKFKAQDELIALKEHLEKRRMLPEPNHSPSEDLKKDRALKGVESYSSSGGDSPKICPKTPTGDTLSSKIRKTDLLNGTRWISGIATKDIKDFIKKLKEELNNRAKKMQKDTGIEMDTEDIINKLAGEDLT